MVVCVVVLVFSCLTGVSSCGLEGVYALMCLFVGVCAMSLYVCE